jgi:hypothetical protein
MRVMNRIMRGSSPSDLAVQAISWAVALCTFVGGLYLFSPIYDFNVTASSSVFAIALAHPISIALWGLILLVGAVFACFGLYLDKPQIKSLGWLAIFLARFFQILTTVLVQGLTPLAWLYPFTVMLVVLILYAVARYEVNRLNATT